MSVETEILPPRYRGAQPIGRGAMGDIYRATDTTLGRAVAIKVLAKRYAAHDDIRARFTREALAAARLSGSPCIVTIFDVGDWNGRPFIVMEYLGGGSLEERLGREGAQSTGQVLAWLGDAARALDAAHAEGVVHRDVKPANLLLDRDDHVHVADFGIASAAGMDSLTQTGTVLGTAGYFSPEQARGERATAASDRYALAVVAFELLTGTRPFQGETTAAEAAAHVHQPVPSVCDRREELPCELDPVFDRALAKRPVDRYPSCREFVEELRHALHEAAGRTQVVAPPTAPTHVAASPRVRRLPSPPLQRRPVRRFWPLAGLLALAAIGGGVAAALTSGGSGADATTRARPQTRTIVRTVTGRGATVQVTTQVTTTVAASAPPPPTQAAASGDPHALTDEATSLMRSGDFQRAAQLAEQAAAQLQGQGPSDPYEAFANYDAGYSLYRLGRCGDAVPYLEKAQQLEPQRSEPASFLAKAEACS